MTLAALKRLCAAYADSSATIKWGDVLVFSTGGKMYATTSASANRVRSLTVKVCPADFDLLTGQEGFDPAPYLAKHHWVRLRTKDDIPEAMVESLTRRSHALIRLRRRRRS